MTMSGLVARIVFPLLFLLQAAAVHAQGAPAPVAPAAATPSTSATPAAPATPTATVAPITDAAAKLLNTAGAIDLIEGDVRILDANRQRRPAPKVGDTLYEGDSVVTGANGELHINMQDGGYLAVRANTQMRIAKYQANGDANDTSVIGLFKGTLRSVTGFIGKYNQKNYLIRTPTATIGVRGTDHEAYVIPANDPTGEAGTYDKVNAGGTFMQTPQGRTEVTPNQAGFAPRGGKPRVLDSVPKFFKPTRNEHLVETHRAAMEPKLQQLREQRKQQAGERRSAAQGGKGKSGGEKAAAAKAGEGAGAAGKTAREQRQAARQEAIAERQRQRQEKLDAKKNKKKKDKDTDEKEGHTGAHRRG
jgi:hypothetical protein